MRISDNFTIYAGGESYITGAPEQQGKKQGGSIFAGDLRKGFCEDRIVQHKEMTQKQAMKVFFDVWEGDKAIDEDLEASRV